VNTAKLLLSSLCFLVLLSGCAERQDANLPGGGNVLAYLGRVPVRGMANDVAFIDGKAYVADAPFGISIYDLSDPAAPALVDSITLFDPNARLIAVDASERVVALQGNSSLNFYDLELRQFLFDAGSSGHVEVELHFSNDTLIVYRSDRFALNGFNVEAYLNLGGDTLFFGFPFSQSKYDLNLTYGFARLGDTQAYVCLDLLGIVLLDYASQPAATVLAQFNTPGQVMDAALDGDILYLASGYEGLVILDVSVPTVPVMVSSLAIPNATNIEFVEAANQRAYLLDTNDGLFAVDVSDPQNPTLIGEMLLSNPQNFCLAGDLVLVADQEMGLVVGQILY
jgi:hypothetical protein